MLKWATVARSNPPNLRHNLAEGDRQNEVLNIEVGLYLILYKLIFAAINRPKMNK